MRRQVASLIPQLGRAFAAENGAVGQLSASWLKRGYADDANLKKTALYDYHVSQGGVNIV